MITIGYRIKEAIDYMDQGKIELALTPTCIALDMTAQSYYAKQNSSFVSIIPLMSSSMSSCDRTESIDGFIV